MSGLIRLSTVGAMVAGSAHGAVTQIGIGDFSGNETVESFEGFVEGPNIPLAAAGFGYLIPGDTSAFAFGSGVALTAPIPNTLNEVLLPDFAIGDATAFLDANGTVSTPGNVPDGSAYLLWNAGSALFELTFDEPQFRVGGLVTANSSLPDSVTIEAFDELGVSLGSASIADVNVADWGTNFLGIEDDTARIKRVRFTGSQGLVLDALRFETTPGVWNEVADAGQDGIDEAQLTWGDASFLTEIRGSLSAGDVDLYCIKIVDEASFSATTVGGTPIDTLLYLFDVEGNGLAFNDQSGGTNQSTIDSTTVTSNGTYFIAVCQWPNQRPLDEQGSLMFPEAPTGAQVSPHQCGGGARPNCNRISGRLGRWTSGAGTTGDYTIFLTGATFSAPRCPTTLHVPESFATIQDAIDTSVDGDEIVVAPGTYPQALSIDSKMITLRSSHGASVTTIDGAGGRALTVLFDVGPNTRVEGFTMIDSSSNGSTLGRQTRITGGASPLFRDNRYPFEGDENSVDLRDGGPIFHRCSFTQGAAFEKVRGDVTNTTRFSSCLFARNGAAITLLAIGSEMELLNCTFVFNTSGTTLSGSNFIGANNVFFGNTGTEFVGAIDPNLAFSNSLFAGAMGSNIDADPRFVDPAVDDFRLGDGSPAIDAGNCSLVPESTRYRDLDGRPRLLDAVSIIDMGPACNGMGPVDMGCYETSPGVKGDCPGDANGDGAVDFGDITTVLGNWLAVCP